MKKLLILISAGTIMYSLGCAKHEADLNSTFTNDKSGNNVIVPPVDTIPVDTIPIDPPIDTTTPPVSNCDTVGVTYTLNVKSIIQQHCVSCHNPNGSEDDDPLDTYNDLTEAVNDDGSAKFLRMIRHTGGYFMPPSYKMSDCQIRQVELWIAAGMPL